MRRMSIVVQQYSFRCSCSPSQQGQLGISSYVSCTSGWWFLESFPSTDARAVRHELLANEITGRYTDGIMASRLVRFRPDQVPRESSVPCRAVVRGMFLL